MKTGEKKANLLLYTRGKRKKRGLFGARGGRGGGICHRRGGRLGSLGSALADFLGTSTAVDDASVCKLTFAIILVAGTPRTASIQGGRKGCFCKTWEEALLGRFCAKCHKSVVIILCAVFFLFIYMVFFTRLVLQENGKYTAFFDCLYIFFCGKWLFFSSLRNEKNRKKKPKMQCKNRKCN